MPKNYDASVAPDSERWLPLRERSYYRGRRRKKGAKDIGKEHYCVDPVRDIMELGSEF